VKKFEIRKNRPIPKRVKPGKKRVYPFDELEVGDSFFVEGRSYQALASCIRWFQTHQEESPPWRFQLVRGVEKGVDGIEVLRIE